VTKASGADPPESGVRGRAWSWFATHSDTRLVRFLRKTVHAATRYVHAENHDILTNGEAFLLDRLAADVLTIFDVGACVGDWALEAVRRCPKASIFCFEIATPNRAQLSERVATQPRIRVMSGGLADAPATVRVKHYPSRPGWTSMHDYPHDAPATWLEEPVSTGDLALDELDLAGVDLLKLDVEGAEMQVLRGFAGALQRHAIRAIQFEYGYAAVFSHALLADYYRLLEPHGYVIGRLARDGVDFAPYRLEGENFFGPNFVAVQAEEAELIARLRR
jgi:FkbM family methyltransferase